MLAVVKEKPGFGFTLKEVEIPEPKSDEVLVKVKSVGICGTDIPIFKGIRKVDYPLIPGHEFSGIIEKIGEDVRNFKVGDRVVPGLVVHCGRCRYCKMGLNPCVTNYTRSAYTLTGHLRNMWWRQRKRFIVCPTT